MAVEGISELRPSVYTQLGNQGQSGVSGFELPRAATETDWGLRAVEARRLPDWQWHH